MEKNTLESLRPGIGPGRSRAATVYNSTALVIHITAQYRKNIGGDFVVMEGRERDHVLDFLTAAIP